MFRRRAGEQSWVRQRGACVDCVSTSLVVLSFYLCHSVILSFCHSVILSCCLCLCLCVCVLPTPRPSSTLVITAASRAQSRTRAYVKQAKGDLKLLQRASSGRRSNNTARAFTSVLELSYGARGALFPAAGAVVSCSLCRAAAGRLKHVLRNHIARVAVGDKQVPPLPRIKRGARFGTGIQGYHALPLPPLIQQVMDAHAAAEALDRVRLCAVVVAVFFCVFFRCCA